MPVDFYAIPISNTATGDVSPDKLLQEIGAEPGITQTPSKLVKFGSNIIIEYDVALTGSEQAAQDAVVAAHQHITGAESLKVYLDTIVFPFIDNLINTFAAENIALGITQAGKTDDVLGLFDKKYPIDNPLRPVSLKASLDTGSLYTSIAVIGYLRSNPLEWSDLSPYITDSRLLKMMNDIEVFLGLPLST